MAGALYLFMSLSFATLGVIIARSRAAAMGPARLSLFALFLIAHTVLHWFGLRLTARGPLGLRNRVAYCVIQSALVIAISFLTSEQRLAIGLWVTLVAETAALLWPEWRPIVLSAALYLGAMALSAILVWGLPAIVQSLPLIAGLSLGLMLYALVLVREGRTRLDAQALVQQLKDAQARLQESAAQIETLTIGQERQRMAREMHDTLAQGLAGVILQLEAVDAHLESNRPAEARVIVGQATQRARQTLHESRRAIQALRSPALEQKDLAGALASVAAEFEAASGIPVELVVEGTGARFGPDVAQDLLRVVQEALSNVGRHAQARHVKIELAQSGHRLRLLLRDDGRGFDVEAAMRRPECFGLQGMVERANRIGAALRVESTPQGGTTLALALEGGPEVGHDPVGLRSPAAGQGPAAREEPSR